MGSLLAAIEGRADEAITRMRSTDVAREPEGIVYLARQYAYLGLSDLAINALKSAFGMDSSVLPALFETIRGYRRFASILNFKRF